MIDSLMTHSVSSNTRNNAAKYSHNTVQGHHHSVFEISYYADMQQIRWSMSVGSLLDPHSPAARYAASNVLKRPILGCGVIVSEKTSNRLVISDLHIPYQHKDAFDFLRFLERLCCVGCFLDVKHWCEWALQSAILEDCLDGDRHIYLVLRR